MQPGHIVLDFADRLLVGLSAIQENSVGVDRVQVEVLQPLTFETLDGDRVRRLPLPEVGTARLHGRGCAIEFQSGADVDFDWDHERRVIFDGWRLHLFARSIGYAAVAEDELVKAARSDTRFVEVEQGWFGLQLLLTRA